MAKEVNTADSESAKYMEERGYNKHERFPFMIGWIKQAIKQFVDKYTKE